MIRYWIRLDSGCSPEEVGGHPRALEYLDALLRGGKAHFPEVEKKLRQALKARGIEEPARWRANVKGQLDRALAETATLAADDVLLDALLGRLDSAPLAHRLLVGVSVYRLPVDEWGLIWQVGKRVERRQDSERTQRLEKLVKAVQETQSREEPLDLKTLGLSQAEIDQFRQDYQEEYGPPVVTPEGFEEALEWYQKALDINEALGNRAGMAVTLSNVGILYTRRKTPEEGIPLNLASLLTNLELQRPEYVRTNLYWLNRQRALLGKEPFLSIVQKQLNEDDTQALIQILDEYKAADKES
jgi:tetratricopeptide (TPR) repeat protein